MKKILPGLIIALVLTALVGLLQRVQAQLGMPIEFESPPPSELPWTAPKISPTPLPYVTPSGNPGAIPSPRLNSSPSPVGSGCVRVGCNNELCVSASEAGGISSACVYRPEYACYQYSTCELQANGRCGFTQTVAFVACRDDILAPNPSDLNGDGVVDLRDLQILVRNLFKSGSVSRTDGDINGDGRIDLRDYAILVRNFLPRALR